MQKYYLVYENKILAVFDTQAEAELEQEVYLLEEGKETTIMVELLLV